MEIDAENWMKRNHCSIDSRDNKSLWIVLSLILYHYEIWASMSRIGNDLG